MTVAQLYARLRARGIAFAVLPDGRLVVDAPKGTLTEAEKQELAARRDELLRLLSAACADCGQPAHPTWPPHLAETPRVRCLPCARAAWAAVYGAAPPFPLDRTET